MSDQRKQFEEWFLDLNYDFTDRELSRIRVGGEYFFTTTQALWAQYQEIDNLKTLIGAAIHNSEYEGDVCSVDTVDFNALAAAVEKGDE